MPGGGLRAAPWTPDPSVADRDGLVLPEVVWAALDCPSGFAIGAGDTVVVLGRMAARVVARPRAGVAYRLLAWREDRRRAAVGRPVRRCWTSTAACWRPPAPSG